MAAGLGAALGLASALGLGLVCCNADKILLTRTAFHGPSTHPFYFYISWKILSLFELTQYSNFFRIKRDFNV